MIFVYCYIIVVALGISLIIYWKYNRDEACKDAYLLIRRTKSIDDIERMETEILPRLKKFKNTKDEYERVRELIYSEMYKRIANEKLRNDLKDEI